LRPFLQQLVTAQAVYGGGSFFATPPANEYFAFTLDGNQGIGQNSTELYDADSSPAVACNLRDVTNGYLVIHCIHGMMEATGATNAGIMRASVREGATASTVDGAGAVIIESFIPEEGVDKTYVSTAFFAERPAASRDSEWGIHIQSATIEVDRVRCSGATMVVLPLLPSGGFTGPTLGTEDNHWGRATPAAISYNNQVGGDADQASTDTLTVGQAGEYLLMMGVRTSNAGTNAVRNLRFNWTVNGVDPVSVRTDTATAGAVKTGRGYQQHYIADADLVQFRPHLVQMALVTLLAGANTVGFRANRHESADPADSELINAGGLGFFAIKTDRFKQFRYTQVATVQSAAALLAYAEDSAWTTQITVDGNAKVMVILSTSVHYAATADITTFKIKRNGVLISPYDTSILGGNTAPETPSMFLGNALNGTIATADSDNGTLPVTIIVADDPGNGTHTYTVETAVSGAGAGIYNSNDNGASGFKGYLMLVELALKVG